MMRLPEQRKPALWRTLLGLVFPAQCVACGGGVENSPFEHLCAHCSLRLHPAGPPACPTCGFPFSGDVAGEHVCPHCLGMEPAFNTGRTALLLQGAGRPFIHALKYRHALHLLDDVRTIIRSSPWIIEHIHGAVLVPVPLHPRKERERGFNQSLLLAQAFAEAGGGLEVLQLLRRIVDTQSQTRLDRKGRIQNLKNAFEPSLPSGFERDRRIVLVDDVFTTGSTLNSCAHALHRGGCRNIDVVTLGHG